MIFICYQCHCATWLTQGSARVFSLAMITAFFVVYPIIRVANKYASLSCVYRCSVDFDGCDGVSVVDNVKCVRDL